jgi:hypothetical protein
LGKQATYALKVTDEHGREKRAGLVRMADILERLGRVTTSLGEDDFVTTGMLDKLYVRTWF